MILATKYYIIVGQITIITMNLIYWTYFDRGYVSLPILAASSGRMTAEALLAADRDWVLMTSLVIC